MLTNIVTKIDGDKLTLTVDLSTVSSSLAGNLGGAFSIIGVCYSEFRSGPNLRHLADVGGATLGPGYYGLQSCRYIGYQISN